MLRTILICLVALGAIVATAPPVQSDKPNDPPASEPAGTCRIDLHPGEVPPVTIENCP